MLTELRKLLPFPLLGFDTDNDSVFMNETVQDYCQAAGMRSPAAGPIARTTRPASSRRTAPSCAASWAIADTRASPQPPTGAALSRLRLFVNFFQPSFKLMEKTRDGARVSKRYHAPLTPFQRVQAHPAVSDAAKDALPARFEALDPVVLLLEIREAQARLVAIADANPSAESDLAAKAEVEQFLSGVAPCLEGGRGQTDVARKADRATRPPPP